MWTIALWICRSVRVGNQTPPIVSDVAFTVGGEMTESSDRNFRVTASPIPEGLCELRRLREQLWTTKGWAIGVDMKNLQRTWYVFHANWSFLDSMIGRFKADTTFAMGIAGTSRRQPKLDSFLDDLDVALHNFIASAATLGDHTRRVANRRVGDDAWKTYQGEVDRIFADAPRSRFVKDLRNYMLHRTLPLAAGSFNYVKDGPLTHAIILHVPSMLDWDGWKPLARNYLDSIGDELDLHECLSAYFEDTQQFQRWFGRHVREVNREALNFAQEIADRGNAMVGPLEKLLDGPLEGETEIPYISGTFRRGR